MSNIPREGTSVVMTEEEAELRRSVCPVIAEGKLERLSEARLILFYEVISKIIDQQDGLAN